MAQLSTMTHFTAMIKQESLANAKGNARQQCMFEGPLRIESKLTDPSNWHWERCIHIRQMAPRFAWLLSFEWPNASILKGVPKF